jgi:hypothetical protein
MSIKNIFKKFRGDLLDDIVTDIKESTVCVCNKVDSLLDRAQLNGEDRWFLTEKPDDLDISGV